MKRVYSGIIAVVAAGTLSAVGAQHPGAAQPSAQSSTQPEHGRTTALMHEKGFIKKGNEVFRVERVTKGTKLEGIQVDPQGNILKDGKKLELREGQMLTPEGQVTQSPLQQSGQ